jgi:23S rRNA (cytosine1962-C5)-methyltransferase
MRVNLKRGEDKRVRNGHPWIFSNEISDISEDKTPGSAAEIFDFENRFIGTGIYNPHSLIAVRLLSRSREDIDSRSFFLGRIKKALELRHSIYPGIKSFRVVFSEADFLPGLIVDKYLDCLVVQFLAKGMEVRKNIIISVLQEIFTPRCIVARNDSGMRKLEGLDETIDVLYGDMPGTVEIEENGLNFVVDLLSGQKTGYFFDQKENHLLLKKISVGKDVLDCFCYSGSWGLHAASFGAKSVTFVDSSEQAIGLLRKNAALNRFSIPMLFERADAFEKLRSYKAAQKNFDIVVLDPPAFVKNRKMIKEAEKGYLTINRRGMELLRQGGYLLTCSCSHHMQREMFRELLMKAARQADKEMRLLEIRTQSYDHPILLNVPETEYLKCFLLQAV